MFQHGINLVTSFLALWPLWISVLILVLVAALAWKSGRLKLEFMSSDYSENDRREQQTGKVFVLSDGELFVSTKNRERRPRA